MKRRPGVAFAVIVMLAVMVAAGWRVFAWSPGPRVAGYRRYPAGGAGRDERSARAIRSDVGAVIAAWERRWFDFLLAPEPEQAVLPLLECVVENGPGDYVAYFGFDSEEDAARAATVIKKVSAKKKWRPVAQQ